MPITHCDIPKDEIARRAYEIWQNRGCPPGDGGQDWQKAEAELIAARIGRNGSTQSRLRSLLGRVRQKIAGE
jgi:hypothetical protein